jgi:FdhD protein
MTVPDKRSAAIRTVPAQRISTADPGASPVDEKVDVVIESPLIIDVEGVERYTVLCTPVDRRAMALGFLFSEGVIDGMEDLSLLEACDDDPNVMRVKLKSGTPRIMDPSRNLLIVSSCGACGTEEFEEKMNALPRVGDTLRIQRSVLRSAVQGISKKQPLFKACGGTHAIGLFDREGKIFSMAEDTGRHNALDKAIGRCLLDGIPFRGSGSVFSGRISLEMVGKCARAGVEVIAAISAPTSLSVEVAERLNITLCAFVRESRATVFTHPGRVVTGSPPA